MGYQEDIHLGCSALVLVLLNNFPRIGSSDKNGTLAIDSTSALVITRRSELVDHPLLAQQFQLLSYEYEGKDLLPQKRMYYFRSDTDGNIAII